MGTNPTYMILSSAHRFAEMTVPMVFAQLQTSASVCLDTLRIIKKTVCPPARLIVRMAFANRMDHVSVIPATFWTIRRGKFASHIALMVVLITPIVTLLRLVIVIGIISSNQMVHARRVVMTVNMERAQLPVSVSAIQDMFGRTMLVNRFVPEVASMETVLLQKLAVAGLVSVSTLPGSSVIFTAIHLVRMDSAVGRMCALVIKDTLLTR